MRKFRLFMEAKVKSMLRKWLKKRVYREGLCPDDNFKRFEWAYNAPLREWRDRIWCLDREQLYREPDILLKLYLYK